MDDRAQIEEAVGQALGNLGLGGTIAVAGSSIELTSKGPPVSIDIDEVLRQWPLLPDDMKKRKAQELARRLAEAQRRSAGLSRKEPRDGGGPPRNFWLVAGIGLGALALVGVVRVALPRLSPPKVEVDTITEKDGEKKQRLARACDAMRDRLYKGASFGPLATEGWVVELWLANKKGGTLTGHPAITSAVAGGKLTAGADEALARIGDGSAEIAEAFAGEAAQQSPGWGGVTLRLREGYARAFLEEDGRPRFVSMASRLAEASGAEIGALYARCAHLETHDIGAWFHGADGSRAVAAMVYEMGFFAEGKMVDRTALSAKRAGGDIDSLEAAAKAEGEALPRLAVGHGGTLSTTRGVSLVFPLSAPMRSLAATRAMAKKMGVGAGPD